MGFAGMNTDEVEKLGNQIAKQATSLGTIATQLDRLVGNLHSIWQGPDAQRFTNDWQQHKSALVTAQQRLDEVGKSALKNVTEQRQASAAGDASTGAGGSSTAAPAASAGNGSTGATAAPAASTSATTGGAVQAAAVSDFAREWTGKGIDYDHAYGNQCFDVFHQYSKEVVGNGNIGYGSIKASDIYNNYSSNGVSQYYDRIPVGQGQPQPGDVIVYGGNTNNGDYGHVAVITEVNGSNYTVLQQNGNNPSGSAYTQSYSLNDNKSSGPILGYLRPKSVAT